MKNNKIIILTAILGACLTSCHTYFISRGFYIGMIVTAFTISMTASFHMKRIAEGTIVTRLCYASGATIGCLVGLFLSKEILKI